MIGMAMELTTPIAFFIFNRPETTKLVFERISRVRPKQLFLIADGPRAGNAADENLCCAAREVVGKVDWPCQVRRNFSENNLGCGPRVASGINWVFENVERAIILEDDCVPSMSFFSFCQDLLDRYLGDTRVMQLNGSNFQLGHKRTDCSYYFSKFDLCWGWATWRRAWKYYDYKLRLWRDLRKTCFVEDIVQDQTVAQYWRNLWDEISDTENYTMTWDYQWTFACWAQHGLSISPRENLVSNVGFGEDATHTKSKKNQFAYSPAVEMEENLIHPEVMAPNFEADRFIIEGIRKEIERKRKRVKSRIRRLARILLLSAHSRTVRK